MSHDEKPVRKHNPARKLWIFNLFAVALIVAAVWFVGTQNAGGGAADADIGALANAGNEAWFDDAAVPGYVEVRTREEIQDELDKLTEAGMYQISIASVIHFEDGGSEGFANIINVEENPFYLSVDIVLEETGECVYSSKGIRQGEYIKSITLDRALPKGEYDAVANFTAYDVASLQPAAMSSIKIVISIKN